jgi:hypothetical protein
MSANDKEIFVVDRKNHRVQVRGGEGERCGREVWGPALLCL